jgi:uncharacterized protein YjiS (DUF1127 family)
LNLVQAAQIMSTTSMLMSWQYGRVLRLLARTLNSLRFGYIGWQDRQRAIAQLSAMSDRELRDISLHRSQIETAVRGTMQDGRN